MGAAVAWAGRIAAVAIPVPIVLIAATAIWLHIDKASAVRRAVDAAIEDAVHSAEKAALAAQLAQERRLREAGQIALAGYMRAMAEADARRAAEDSEREQEIADYERKLEEAGRACLLDGDDVDWLRR